MLFIFINFTYLPNCFYCSIAKCINGTIFNEKQLEDIFRLMKKTLYLASNLSNGSPNESNSCSNDTCKSMSVLIIKLDQNNDRIELTSAVSDTRTSPLNHAVIMAIENVAIINHDTLQEHNTKPAFVSDQDCINITEEEYLCSNYECFLSQDPCIMCAMALVHSRFKRVFIYSGSSSEEWSQCNDHAFQTHKLHLLKNLNHHYEVWKLSPFELINKTGPEVQTNTFPNKKVKSDDDNS